MFLPRLGGQDKPGGKSGITSDQQKGSVVSCGPFPIQWCGRNAGYQKCFQAHNFFFVFCFYFLFLFFLFFLPHHFTIGVPICFAPAEDSSPICGQALELQFWEA